MKRAWTIIFSGVALAIAAYFGFYYVETAHTRRLQENAEPELAWLKTEFHLNDADFARVSQLHDAYLAGCAERCRRIDEKNARLKELLASNQTVTPEIEKLLEEAAQLRADCQKKMLAEFFAVSRTMPPEQGRRYLAWVQSRTILPDTHSSMTAASEPPAQDHSHH